MGAMATYVYKTEWATSKRWALYNSSLKNSLAYGIDMNYQQK